MSRPLPEDPLQRAFILWLRDLPNLSELARRLLRQRGKEPEDPARRRLAVTDLRTALSRMRSGKHPDVPLSTVSELAQAMGEDPVLVLSYEKRKKLAAVADEARAKAAKKGGR